MTTYDVGYKQGKQDAYEEIIHKLEKLNDMPGCVGTTLSERHISLPWLIQFLQEAKK
jgi:hypothetical protein